MKIVARMAFALSLAQLLVLPSASAQYLSPRQYMRRIAPQLPPPAPRPAPTPAQPATQPATPPLFQPSYQPPAPVDPEKAKADKDAQTKRVVEFQTQRAEGGSPSAQYDLGLRYMTGDGVEKDLVKARKWLEKAAANKNPAAPKKLEELAKLERESPAKAAVGEAKPLLAQRAKDSTVKPASPPEPATAPAK